MSEPFTFYVLSTWKTFENWSRLQPDYACEVRKSWVGTKERLLSLQPNDNNVLVILHDAPADLWQYAQGRGFIAHSPANLPKPVRLPRSRERVTDARKILKLRRQAA